MGRINRGKQLEGSIINGFRFIKSTGYNKCIVECLKCHTTRPGRLDALRKNKVRCKGCNPSDREIYTQDITDMYLDGRGGPEIANVLGIGITIVYSVIAAFKENLGIEEIEVEYKFSEISEYLGLSEFQAKEAYKSGMKKIKEYLLSLDDFKDM